MQDRPILTVARVLFVASTLFASVVGTASAASSSANVPMDTQTGRPAIPASIAGGKPMQVNYDTGSQGALIAQSLVNKLKLKIIGEALVGSPAGGAPAPVKLVSLRGLTVGGYAAATTDAMVMEDANFPPGVTVVIGNNQFPDALIEVDYKNARFKLSKAKAHKGSENPVNATPWQPLNERGMPEGKLTVGGETVPLHIDSGNPGLLDLPKSLVEKLPVKGELKQVGAIRLVDREVPLFAAPLQTDADLAGLPIKLDGHILFVDLPFANLGGRALKDTVIRIDMAKRRWQLQFSGEGTPTIGMPPPMPRPR